MIDYIDHGSVRNQSLIAAVVIDIEVMKGISHCFVKRASTRVAHRVAKYAVSSASTVWHYGGILVSQLGYEALQTKMFWMVSNKTLFV